MMTRWLCTSTRWIGLLLAVTASLCAQTPSPVRLTTDVHDDTEAAWSPDGRRIAFQRLVDGTRHLVVLDLQSAEETVLDTGDMQALYPAWTPDSTRLVFTAGRMTATAVQAATEDIPEGFNLWTMAVDGGTPRRLTAGRSRDYAPEVSPDGEAVWFTSTRGFEKNSAALWRLPLAPVAGDPVHVFGDDTPNAGAVQPSLSPDGATVVFGRYAGIRSNWQLWLLDAADPARVTPLTPETLAAYAPRWSPDGQRIACTGYRVGDPGWGIWLVEARTGRALRLDTGPGNARSPAWSPDGQQLAFESNPDGQYDLYRMAVGEVTFASPDEQAGVEARTPVLRFEFDAPLGERIPDRTGSGNDAKINGTVEVADGQIVLGQGDLQILEPKRCDFGKGAFYVTAKVRVDKHTDDLRILVVGSYPEHSMGWQIYLNKANTIYFNARSPGGSFIGVTTREPFPVGRTVTVTGMRSERGTVYLYLDGRLVGTASGATMSYGNPNQIRIGCQFGGGARCPARLESLEVGRGYAPVFRTREQQLQEFFAR